MKLETIITIANRRMRLAFLAMERSLRATGCRLPLSVIPYDDDRFELPPGAHWLECPELDHWLDERVKHRHPRAVMRKYQCLLAANYQFVDTDVVFVRDPSAVLQPFDGFVACCGHWHNPGHAVTAQSLAWLQAQTTTWQRSTFNSGQFACSRALYDLATLKAAAQQPAFRATCLDDPFHEQPGLNLLVAASGVPVTNLTLPPHAMESSWAGDYPDDWERYWTDPTRRPYLIHWAGRKPDGSRPIDSLFLDHLSRDERSEWVRQARDAQPRKGGASSLIRRLRDAWRAFRQS